MEEKMKNELAFASEDSATTVARILMNEDYVVMLSKEENLTIVNFEYSQYSDRNGVVFMSRDEYKEELFLRGDD